MKIKALALTALTALMLTACGNADSSATHVPADVSTTTTTTTTTTSVTTTDPTTTTTASSSATDSESSSVTTAPAATVTTTPTTTPAEASSSEVTTTTTETTEPKVATTTKKPVTTTKATTTTAKKTTTTKKATTTKATTTKATTTTKKTTTTTTKAAVTVERITVEENQEETLNNLKKLINEERAKAGLEPVTFDEKLMQAAQIRAKEAHILYDHIRPNGEVCTTILAELGISYRGCFGEILTCGGEAASAMHSWMNSAGHKAHIVAPTYKYAGIGAYKFTQYYDFDEDGVCECEIEDYDYIVIFATDIEY